MREECNFANALDYQPNKKYIVELIKQNPYNVIGILAGARARTIEKQRSKIKALQKIGKSIKFDTDLEFLGNPDRSNGSITKAFANITINKNKIFHALFWFVNYNHIDEIALKYLQLGDIEKAEKIWQKITSGKEVSSKNFTAFNNLGTLKLAIEFNNETINVDNLKEAVRLKTELFTSDCFNNFCYLVADETYTVNQDKELETFINALLEEVKKMNSIKAKQIFIKISSAHPKIKSLILEKLTATSLNNIERKIEQTKKLRAKNPKDSLQLGRKLYKNTKNDLITLSKLLGKSDLKYKIVADKVAKEILQCGIDYFIKYKNCEDKHESGGIPQEHFQYTGISEPPEDLGTSVMNLFKIAKSTAVGTLTKERITENIEGLQEWIDNADERRKTEPIAEDLAFVVLKLGLFKKLAYTIENADVLVTSCKPKLQNMKKVLGANDDFYLKISGAVASNAMVMLVTIINEAQQDLVSLLYNLKDKVREAIRVSEKIGSLDMVSELREQYNNNHRTLKSIGSQLGISFSDSSKSTRSSIPDTSSTSTSSSSSDSEKIPDWIKVVVLIILFIILMRACAG